MAARPRIPPGEDGWRSLANALASIWRMRSRVSSKRLPDLIEGARHTVVESVAQHQHGAFSLVEFLEHFHEILLADAVGDDVERGQRLLIFDEVAERRIVVSDGFEDRDGLW